MKGTDIHGGKKTWILETTHVRKAMYHLPYDFQTARLWVDANTGMIVRVDLMSADKEVVGIIRFYNITINQGITDNTFVFVPGNGMKIVDQKAGLLYRQS